MNSSKSIFFITSLSFFTSSCAYLFSDDGMFPSKENDYLKAEEHESLTLSKDKQKALHSDEFDVPRLDQLNISATKFEVPRLPGIDERTDSQAIKIQRFDGDEWVLVNKPPSASWPLLMRFLEVNKVPISDSDVTEGFAQTGWLIQDADGQQSLPRQYLFQIRSGVQQNTSEILVTKREDREAKGTDELDFSADKSMTVLVAEYFANSSGKNAHSLLARGLGSYSKIYLRYNEQGEPFLDLDLPFPRAWASMELSLKKTDFEVVDLNRSEGLYIVKLDPNKKDEEKRGWFSRLFSSFRGDQSKSMQHAYRLYLAPQKDDPSKVAITIEGYERSISSNEKIRLLKILQPRVS